MTAAVIYCRCSTEEEHQVDALKKQVMEAEACAAEMGWILADRYVESKSGTTAKGRPEYSRLFEDMLSSKFEVIIIKSQDRLMRNTKDWYLFLDRMLTHKKRLYLYLEKKFYSKDDSLITGIKAILAEEYSRELSQKINNAHRYRQQNGGRAMLTNQVFGYRKEIDGRVTVEEGEAKILRRIYRYCAEGYGSRTIANLLEKENVRSRKGNFMNAATIRRIIRNPLYKGIFVMNRQHFDFETKTLYKNPEEEWICREGIVPEIVDPGLWERANAAMSGRAEENHAGQRGLRGRNRGNYMLSGKLICGKCGSPYYRTWRKGTGNSENKIFEWKCKEYVIHGRAKEEGAKAAGDENLGEKTACRGCRNSSLDEAGILKLLGALNERQLQKSGEDQQAVLQRIMDILRDALRCGESERELEGVRQEIAALRNRKKVLMDKLLDSVVSDEDFQRQNRSLEQCILENERKLSEIQEKIEGGSAEEKRLEVIKKWLLNGGFEKALAGQIAGQIERIIVHEWQLEVWLKPSFRTWKEADRGKDRNLIPGEEKEPVCIFLEYPFLPNTEKGRFLDRKRVIEYIKNHPETTINQMAREMDRTVSVLRNRVKELMEGGYLCFEGRGGRGKWKILKDFSD